jgi:hypothetical protein
MISGEFSPQTTVRPSRSGRAGFYSLRHALARPTAACGIAIDAAIPEIDRHHFDVSISVRPTAWPAEMARPVRIIENEKPPAGHCRRFRRFGIKWFRVSWKTAQTGNAWPACRC